MIESLVIKFFIAFNFYFETDQGVELVPLSPYQADIAPLESASCEKFFDWPRELDR